MRRVEMLPLQLLITCLLMGSVQFFIHLRMKKRHFGVIMQEIITDSVIENNVR